MIIALRCRRVHRCYFEYWSKLGKKLEEEEEDEKRSEFSFFRRTNSNIGTRYSRTKLYNVLTDARFERPTHERTYFNLCE